MQDLQQQSAMLQKEYEYEKELYRQQTREAGICLLYTSTRGAEK